MSFFPGQRWVSQTEAELGLGIIVENNGRHVTVSFPAAADRRVYAVSEAPLTRVIYQPGDKVRSLDNIEITIESLQEQQGCIVYTGVDSEGEAQTLSELELDSFIQFSKPEDRLFAGQIDKLRDFRLRYQTRLVQHQLQTSQVQGLFGPRVDLLPHQLYIAHNVANRHAPRVLLADEVGLGKTIEAGLIIHQQLTKGTSQRVLIAVPDALQHQWLVEMLRRFNLAFTLLDEDRCQALEESGHSNPFEAQQWVICALHLLTENEERLAQALEVDWDLLVVDEAHHLQWQEDNASQPYRCIEALARQSRGLIMLTATPEQLGMESHFARLRLLDPGRYHSLDRFREEQQQYQPLNTLVQALLDGNPGSADLDRLAQLTDPDTATNWASNTEALIRQLLDRHGTGRVLFRNTRASVKGFPERQLHPWPLTAPAAYTEQQASAPITALLKPEQLLGDDWVEHDSRVTWLQQWLKENRQEKVLIICADADTALDLEFFLRLRGGVRTAAFHEAMSLLERDRAAAYFADDIDGAQVLICSEIGSEGRNFQFSHNLVLFDLPLNPDLLEQRIGRLDRIGQQHRVDIHVPYYSDSAQEVLLNWYHQGINAFEQVCPIGQAMFEQFSEQLFELLQSGNSSNGEVLASATRRAADELQAELQAGRDRLLEMNSCDSSAAATLIEQLQQGLPDFPITDYMSHVFDVYGVDYEKHSEDALVIHPSDHMQTDYFPHLPDEGLTATYSRTQALSREDMHYLTWEHPMVTGCIDMILGSERGNSSLCTIKLPPLKPGTLMVEAIYEVYCPAPRTLQMQQFFSGGCLRILLDSEGRDLSKVVGFEHINKLSEKVKLKIAQQLVRQAQEPIRAILQKTEPKAQAQMTTLLHEAREKLLAHSQSEIERLQQLARVNPNIRQEEIDYLQDLQQQQVAMLEQSQLRLDAIRVVLTT